MARPLCSGVLVVIVVPLGESDWAGDGDGGHGWVDGDGGNDLDQRASGPAEDGWSGLDVIQGNYRLG